MLRRTLLRLNLLNNICGKRFTRSASTSLRDSCVLSLGMYSSSVRGLLTKRSNTRIVSKIPHNPHAMLHSQDPKYAVSLRLHHEGRYHVFDNTFRSMENIGDHSFVCVVQQWSWRLLRASEALATFLIKTVHLLFFLFFFFTTQ